MENLSAVQSKPKPPADESWSPGLHHDPHWELPQRVVAGPHFARSPLLSKFLLFVVAETLEGRGAEITEHQIGVQVFDRPADYRTLDDNIVRNYARQLRKRLAEHFAGEGSAELIRIDVPVGGYVPVFVPVGSEGNNDSAGIPVSQTDRMHGVPAQPGREQQVEPRRGKTKRIVAGVAIAVVYSAVLVAVESRDAARRMGISRSAHSS